MSRGPAFLFDLDGTLVDSVYQHVLAWREALEEAGIQLAVWRIHRRVGMSGGLFVNALLRETGRKVTAQEAERIQRLHAQSYARQADQVVSRKARKATRRASGAFSDVDWQKRLMKLKNRWTPGRLELEKISLNRR